MSDQDKKRWQQHIPHVVGGEKCQAWVRTVWREIESRDNESRAKDLMQLLQEFPEIEAELLQCKDAYDRYRQGERYGARLIWIAKGTEIKDIQAQLLAYLLQDGMVQWDKVDAWFQIYRQSFGKNDTCAERFFHRGRHSELDEDLRRPLPEVHRGGQRPDNVMISFEYAVPSHELSRGAKKPCGEEIRKEIHNVTPPGI